MQQTNNFIVSYNILLIFLRTSLTAISYEISLEIKCSGRNATSDIVSLNSKGSKKGLIASGGCRKREKKGVFSTWPCHLARYSRAPRNKVVGDLWRRQPGRPDLRTGNNVSRTGSDKYPAGQQPRGERGRP